MREIVIDTETTGLDPRNGDRIVEIAAVELVNHLPTGRVFHHYLNPEREMSEDAFAIHGLGTEFLADKPRFAEIADSFAQFIDGARLVIHATSLGGVETLIERRARYPSEARAGTPPTLIRVSVGIENVEDLWVDLDRALTEARDD